MKPNDVESQRPLIPPDPNQVQWNDIKEIIEQDNSDSLSKLLQQKSFEFVWRPRDAPQNKTILHKAIESGAIRCTNLILDFQTSISIADSPDGDGNTALVSAIKTGQVECLKLLQKKANVNARNDLGHNPLHTIAYTLSSGTNDEHDQKRILECCDLLLEGTNIDLEGHNNSGFTPLVAAAKKIQVSQGVPRIVELVTFCRRLVSKGASLDAQDGRRVTARELLEKHSALTEVLMGERRSPPQRAFYSLFVDAIIMGSNGYQLKDLLLSQPQEESHRISNSYIGSKTLLFHAVDKNDVQATEALLEAGADPWKEQPTGERCIHRSLSRGHLEILNLLIEHMKRKINEKTLDFRGQCLAILSKPLEGQGCLKGSDSDHFKCLERMLEPDILIDLNERSDDKISQTILHVAAAFNNQDALKLFLQKGAFIGSRKYVVGENRGNILNVLQSNTLFQAMDQCITHHRHEDDNVDETENIQAPDYAISLNYQFLIPPLSYNSDKTPLDCNEIESLMEVSRNRQHKKTVNHPLIQAFLYAKWRKVLPFYLLNLFLYLFFVVLLTAFMYALKDQRILEERALSNPSNATLLEQITDQRHTVNVLMAFLLISTIYMIIREAFQVIFSFKSYYRNVENLFEWILIIMVMVLCTTNLSIELTRHLAAWSMIIAWYEFVLLLGRAPFLAIYVTMLRHVSYNFLKLIFLYGALILAFTVSFNIILQPTMTSQGDENFNNFWSTLPKAIVMATGEFEYSDLSNDFSNKVFFATSAALVFLVFLFLIFLVLMNVMNGLAVCDTQLVVDDATLYSLRSRLELIYLIEELLLRAPFLRRFLHKIHLITGSKNPRLLASINRSNKGERFSYGPTFDKKCKMDDDTVHLLRSHRLEFLAAEREKSRGDPVMECLLLLQELKDSGRFQPSFQQHQSATLSPSSSRGNFN